MDNKLSILIDRTLPEFIRDEHPTFTDFIKAWLDYLDDEENGAHYHITNIKDYVNPDDTSAALIGILKKAYMVSYPEIPLGNVLATDNRFLVKQLRTIYAKKGAEDAYNFFFRAQFNENIKINYPKEYIFRASDGKWFIPKYITFTSVSSDIAKFFNKKIRGLSSGATAFVDVEEDVDPSNIIATSKLPVTDVRGSFILNETIEVVV
jgi:hypothetical protein